MKIISLTHWENRLFIYHRERRPVSHLQLASFHKHLCSWELSEIFPQCTGRDPWSALQTCAFIWQSAAAFKEWSKTPQDYSRTHSPFHQVSPGRAFSAPSHQAVADVNEVSASPSLLQAELTHLTQSLLVCPVLQPWPFWWPLLDSLDLHWEPKWPSTADGVSPAQKKSKDPLPCHAGCTRCCHAC